MNKPFRFKQFSVQQERCAMKVGTDSVLLGAWASLEHNPRTILDIGAGTGILSLMLAQRSDAEILDAFEIDENAFEQCSENFEASPWSDRLFCYHASLNEFTDEIGEKYDSIICNPPFFSENYKTNSTQRNAARFQDAMPFSDLMKNASFLMETNSVFSLIIPYNEEKKALKIASDLQLYPKRLCRVRGNTTSKIKRTLLDLTFSKSDIEISEIAIEISRHNHTKEYVNLTKDFYLKM